MRKFFSFSILVSLSFYSCNKPAESPSTTGEILVTVTRDYEPRPSDERATVLLDWSEITSRIPAATDGFVVIDQHFGKQLEASRIDTDGDGSIDKISVDYPFVSSEPVYTLMIKAGKGTVSTEPEKADVNTDSRFKITYLQTYQAFSKGDTITNWSERIFESTINKYPDPASLSIISPGEWTYEYGFFLNAGYELWLRSKKDEYYNYIKNWTDRFLTPDGRIKEEEYDVTQYRLDDILPGRLCVYLYQTTGDERYKKAADQLRDHLAKQPKTSDGGYWHKQIYPYQMWLDGIYMGDVFSTHYAAVFNEPDLFNEAAHQIKLISQHTLDSVTGLMYHGWDESKNPVWAHPVKGTSPEFWGRAIGWYIMALGECLDYIPENHPDRPAIVSIFQNLAQSVLKYQDEDTGLWYQVVDKGAQPGNWIETSCSAMFAYAFAKGYNKGILDKSFYDTAKRAFNSIIAQHCYFDDSGNLYLNQTVKVGTLNLKVSKGDYDYYISTERRINDYKGLAALLYASLELSKTGGETIAKK